MSEQQGMVVRGLVTFTIDDPRHELGPGGTWRVYSQRPQQVLAGPEGAVVIDEVSPIRSDWDFAMLVPRLPRWPEA